MSELEQSLSRRAASSASRARPQGLVVLVEGQTVLSLEKGAETLLAWSPLVETKGRQHLHIESMQEWLSHLSLAKEGPAHSAPAPPKPTSSHAFGLLDEELGEGTVP